MLCKGNGHAIINAQIQQCEIILLMNDFYRMKCDRKHTELIVRLKLSQIKNSNPSVLV